MCMIYLQILLNLPNIPIIKWNSRVFWLIINSFLPSFLTPMFLPILECFFVNILFQSRAELVEGVWPFERWLEDLPVTAPPRLPRVIPWPWSRPCPASSNACSVFWFTWGVSLGVEQNRNRNFEQKPKLVPARSRYRKYRHTGHNFQEESRKNIFFLYIYSKSERWKWKRKNILPAFFLKVVAGMPVFPVSWSSRNQFWLLLKVSVSVSVQPLGAGMILLQQYATVHCIAGQLAIWYKGRGTSLIIRKTNPPV